MVQNERRLSFLSLIAEDDDAATESAVHRLSPADESWLLELASSQDPDQRWWGIRALAQCGSAACVSVLTGALDDEDVPVRAVGVLALAHLFEREPQAVQPLMPAMAHLLGDDDGTVRQTAADALSQCGDDAVDALAGVLAGDNQAARTRAAAALRKIATMKAAGVLYRQLNDTNYLVRSYAYEALDEMGLLETQLLIL